MKVALSETMQFSFRVNERCRSRRFVRGILRGHSNGTKEYAERSVLDDKGKRGAMRPLQDLLRGKYLALQST